MGQGTAKEEVDEMSGRQKKKGSRILKRCFLASACVLMLTLTFFVIKKISRLTDMGAYAYADAGKTDDVAETWKSQTTDVTEVPKPSMTPTPQPLLTAAFSDAYAHTGEARERISYERGIAYGLRYPVYEDTAIQEAVQNAAEELLAKELESASEAGTEQILLIDYEDGAFGQLVSVLFRVEREKNGEKEYEAFPWVYNKKKGEAVDAGTLFADRAYCYIAEQVNGAFAEETAATEIAGNRESFSAYLLTAEGARFFYEKNGEEHAVTISYPELHTYMAVTVGGTVIAETIRDLAPDQPMIALTFDDGPHYQQTPRLLEILEKNNVRATFFLLGSRAEWSGSPEAVEKIAASGNEIASHTHNHENLATLSEETLIAEIENARETIYNLTGDYPTFIRPPYGSFNDLVKKYANAPLITWNLDSEDWKSRDTDTIVAHVLEEAGDGKIVLMHDIHYFTVDAAEILIPELLDRGYQLVTLRELFYYKGVDLENGKVYHSAYN